MSAAVCGVTRTCGRPSNGWCACGGSSASTSSPAARRCPPRSASTSASSSTSPPRETFSKTAPGFIVRIRPASRKPVVCSFSARCRLTTSLLWRSSSSETAGKGPGRGERDQDTTSMPMPRAISAKSRPMRPMPTTPRRLPPRSNPRGPSRAPQPPDPAATLSGATRRQTQSRSASACSAVLCVKASGACTTGMPAAVAAATSMCSVPDPTRATQHNDGPAARSMAAETRPSPRVTMAATPATSGPSPRRRRWRAASNASASACSGSSRAISPICLPVLPSRCSVAPLGRRTPCSAARGRVARVPPLAPDRSRHGTRAAAIAAAQMPRSRRRPPSLRAPAAVCAPHASSSQEQRRPRGCAGSAQPNGTWRRHDHSAPTPPPRHAASAQRRMNRERRDSCPASPPRARAPHQGYDAAPQAARGPGRHQGAGLGERRPRAPQGGCHP